MRTSALLAALLLASAVPPPAAVAQDAVAEPRPGRWEYRYRILRLPVGTEHWCVKPEEVRRVFEGPCNRHHTCTYPVHEVGGGKMRLEGRWVDKRGRIALVKGQGVYGAEQIQLNFSGRSIHGIPFAGDVRATRIADGCEPGDK